MENLLTYIIQVNLLLAFIYLGYHFLLKSLTFYNLNRIYFLIGCLYAFAYPFIDFKSWFAKNEVLDSTFFPEFLPAFQMPDPSTSQITLLDLIVVVLGLFAVVFFIKLIVQIFSLLRIHLHSEKSIWQSYLFRNVVFPIVPFSFFNKIYIHKEQHQENELQDIFAHEIVHVKGHHTVDILLFEMILVVCWYNPFVWLMRKAVRQNLEFLTDQQVLNKGVDKQTYQYSLLHVTRQGVAVGMSNHFNFKTLKKRIMMMNKKRSSKLELSKYAFLLPVFLITGMSFTVSKAENNIEKIVEVTKEFPFDVLLPNKKYSLNEDKAEVADTLAEDDLGYILDDKLVDVAKIKELNAKDIESVIVYYNNDLTRKYGKSSILNIKTKKFAGTIGTPSQYKSIIIDKNNVLTVDGKLQVLNDSNSKDSLNGNKYPLLAPDFDRKELEGKNLHFEIDGKLVSLDEFLEFPRTEIYGVDIYKDKEEIRKKIGKENSEGLFVMTSKRKNSTNDKQMQTQDFVKRLKNKSEIDPDRKFIYDYDGKILSKSEFLGIADDNLKRLTHMSGRSLIKVKYSSLVSNWEEYEGVIHAISLQSEEKFKEQTAKVLFIIDGVEKGIGFDLEDLDPNDIESMNVLKGENATTVYGDKGKDGVIEIKTKKNKNKEVVVTGYESKENISDSVDVKTKGAVKEVIVIGHKK